MQIELKRYLNKSNYNLSCSEIIMHAANDYYDLGLQDACFKMMSGFSGGMFEGELCGIVSASIGVIGIMFTEDCKANSPKLADVVKEFKQRFKVEFKTRDCTPLKDIYKDENLGCANLIYAGGILLKEIIDKYI